MATGGAAAAAAAAATTAAGTAAAATAAATSVTAVAGRRWALARVGGRWELARVGGGGGRGAPPSSGQVRGGGVKEGPQGGHPRAIHALCNGGGPALHRNERRDRRLAGVGSSRIPRGHAP